MNILAIDTSTNMLSLALSNEVQSQFLLKKVDNSHSEYIIQSINDLFNLLNMKKTDLSLIVYNKGPGSFTGVRIGLSVSIGIATGLNIPLVAISSFDLHAKQFQLKVSGDDYEILTIIDARLNQLYVARHNNKLEYSLQPCLVDIDYMISNKELFLSPNKLNIITGNALSIYPELKILLESNMCEDFSCYQSEDYPNALNLIELYKHKSYRLLDVTNAELLYLRDKVALNLIEQNSK
jgi:tRNA threonylcarbamoyladenosine biosynthesis protein TsaB